MIAYRQVGRWEWRRLVMLVGWARSKAPVALRCEKMCDDDASMLSSKEGQPVAERS